jgi:chemotaxis protein methyltransferase CheR
MLNLPPELFCRFQELVYGRSSLRFSPSRLIHLEMQLRERVKARGLPNYEDYFQLLQEDVREFDALIEGITTKETYFFRLPGQFRALAKDVLPRVEDRLAREAQRIMVDQGGPGPWNIPLRIWSAGCATGEEPYSIAMAVLSGLKYPRAWQIELLASDISKEAVTTASLGFYDTGAIDKVPAIYQKKYIRTVSGGGVIAEELLKKISFRVFNLNHLEMRNGGAGLFTRLDGTREGLDLHERFELIFCRNVMIYFDFAAQQRLIDNLYACLKPGGHLFIGDAELLNIYPHGFETAEFEGTYYYRKPERDCLSERIKANE